MNYVEDGLITSLQFFALQVTGPSNHGNDGPESQFRSYPQTWQGMPNRRLNGVDAVINLAEMRIADNLAHARAKERRAKGWKPQKLVCQFDSCQRHDSPSVLISRLATGYHGDC